MKLLRSLKPVYYLLLALPLAILGSNLHWDALVVFGLACLGLIPLAGLIGEAPRPWPPSPGPRSEACSTPRWAMPPS